MKIPLVRPLFRAAWTVAGFLNPIAAVQSPVRRKVAALLLGTGSVAGFGGGSYYYVNHVDPTKSIASTDDVEPPAAKKPREPVQPIPIEPDDEPDAVRPPPANMFTSGGFRQRDDVAVPRRRAGGSFRDDNNDNAADDDARPSPFGKPRVMSMHDGAIRRAADEQPDDGSATDGPANDASPYIDRQTNEPDASSNDTDRDAEPGGRLVVGAAGSDSPPPLTKPRAAPLPLSPPPDLSPPPPRFNPGREPAPAPAMNSNNNGLLRNARNTGGPADHSLAPSLPASTPAATHATSSAPGAKQLEGLQAPSIALEKTAPAEIQVGKPAAFQIKVRNTGRVAAHQVTVFDQVPAGTRLVETSPQASETPDGALAWRLGTLQPGEDALVSMQVVPEQEGDIGSVAQVTFQAQASVRTRSTKPQVTLKQTGPAKALIGESVLLTITVSNTGTGPATGLFLEASIPDGFSFPSGNDLEYELGVLRPGETKSLQLPLKAVKAGAFQHVVAASNDANVSITDSLDIEVTAPQLAVGIAGPKVRYLDRQATYTVSVANGGTAAAADVELAAILPKGFKFVSANNNGQYDARNHAVFWSLERLPAGGRGDVQLAVLPIEIGEKKLRVEGRANLGLEHVHEHAVQVEALSELQFSVADTADPIEVGSDTVYEIRIVNKGSKAATNVQLIVTFPGEIRPVSGDGPTRVIVDDQRVTIEPLAKLSPNNQALYKIQAQGLDIGDPRIRVQLLSEESPNPVTKEESTRVYADK